MIFPFILQFKTHKTLQGRYFLITTSSISQMTKQRHKEGFSGGPESCFLGGSAWTDSWVSCLLGWWCLVYLAEDFKTFTSA